MYEHRFKTNGKVCVLYDSCSVYTPKLIELIISHPRFFDMTRHEIFKTLKQQEYGIRFSPNQHEFYLCTHTDVNGIITKVQIPLGLMLAKYSYNAETRQAIFKTLQGDGSFSYSLNEANEKVTLQFFADLFSKYPNNYPPLMEELEYPVVKRKLEMAEEENRILKNKLIDLQKQNIKLQAQLERLQPKGYCSSPVLFRRS